VLLVRGGGSRTDLLTFDSEAVAEAIAQSALPVFTGVGHEIDVSIADEVAHRSFKTPTACAAGVVAMVNNYVTATEQAWGVIATQSLTMLQRASHDLAATAGQVRSAVATAVATAQSRLEVAADRLQRRPREILKTATYNIDAAAGRVRLLDPVHAMARGWSIVRDERGKTIRSVKELTERDVVTAYFADGTVRAEVQEVTHEGKGRH
jgi:exodeoxyribonuclease VII large subunit